MAMSGKAVFVMVHGLPGMNVRFDGRGGESARENDAAALLLFGEAFGNIGMKGANIADQAAEKALGLKRAAGEFGYKLQRAVQHFRRGRGVDDVLRFLLCEVLVFLLEMLGKNRHRCGGHMQRAEYPAERLDRGDHLRVLAVAATLEVVERDDLDQVEQCRRFFSAELAEFSIQFTPGRRELFSQSPLLIFAAGVQVHAVGWAGDTDDAMLAAALAADQSVQGRTGSLSLAPVTIGALAHFFVVPSGCGLGGGETKP